VPVGDRAILAQMHCNLLGLHSVAVARDDGVACQEVLDAVEHSGKTGGWVGIPLD